MEPASEDVDRYPPRSNRPRGRTDSNKGRPRTDSSGKKESYSIGLTPREEARAREQMAKMGLYDQGFTRFFLIMLGHFEESALEAVWVKAKALEREYRRIIVEITQELNKTKAKWLALEQENRRLRDRIRASRIG